MSGLVLAGEERNVAVAELRAVRSAVRDGEYAETLDGILSTLERVTHSTAPASTSSTA